MFPKIVVICGSSRFVDVMSVISWWIERDEKAIVLGLHLLPKWYFGAPDHVAEEEGVATQMDVIHLRKIEMADEVFVVDVDGYIGSSTKLEIEFAQSHGKRVRYLHCDPLGMRFDELFAKGRGGGQKHSVGL